jgi:DnaK suppressor protein
LNIDDFKQRLLALERELSARVRRETAEARDQIETDPSDAGDRSTLDELKEEEFTEENIDAATLVQVRDALRRIEEGTFGRCVVDGGPIEEKRLQAVPWTPYCIRHQQLLEGTERPTTPTL